MLNHDDVLTWINRADPNGQLMGKLSLASLSYTVTVECRLMMFMSVIASIVDESVLSS